jgi:hypothetical protein
MKKSLALLLCAVVVPGMALAFTEYVDEAMEDLEEDLEEIGVPFGESPDDPAGVTPDDPATPSPDDPASPGAPGTNPKGPAKKVKKDYSPEGETTLIVTSSPAAARVTVDGKDVGMTPLYCTDLEPGRHAVKVADLNDEVELRPGGITHLDVTYTGMEKDKTEDKAVAGKYVDNRDNYFELHIGDK